MLVEGYRMLRVFAGILLYLRRKTETAEATPGNAQQGVYLDMARIFQSA